MLRNGEYAKYLVGFTKLTETKGLFINNVLKKT